MTRNRFSKASLAVTLGLLAAVLLVMAPASHAGKAPRAAADQAQANSIVLGALLSLTGNGASLGQSSQAALNLASQDINAEFAAAGSPLRVSIAIEDTQQLPDVALAKAQDLAAQGVQVAIGPQTSAEVNALMPYVDANGMLLISQGSTASSLSNRNDNILRFVPDDTHEIEALNALLKQDGITAVVPMWRADAGNQGLHNSLVRLFPASGGTVSDGVEYATDTQDFSTQIAALHDQVQLAQQEHGNGAVAVFLASFEEAVSVFHAASNDPLLSSVRWYGSDGVVLSDALTGDPQAAAFAAIVNFVAPDLGLDAAAKDVWQPLSARVQQITGFSPDAFGLAAYDAAWVAALAYAEAGPGASTPALRQTIVDVAGRYFGATGRTILNSAGDRTSGDFDFWAVRAQGGGYGWVDVASYQVSPGSSGGGVITTAP